MQEYNRDLSVVAIRSWSEIRQREKRAVWEESLKRRREKKRGKEAATKGEEEEGKGKKRKAEDGKAVEGESKEAEKKEVKEASEPAVKVEEVSLLAFSFLSELADEIQECSRNTKSRLTNRQSTNLLFLKLFQRLDSEQSDTRKRSHYYGKLTPSLALLLLLTCPSSADTSSQTISPLLPSKTFEETSITMDSHQRD